MWKRNRLRILCLAWIVGLILATPLRGQTGVNNAELKGDYAVASIVYVLSPTKFLLISTNDINPAVAIFEH